MRFRKIEGGSFYSYLTEGCRLCRKGAKMVLFITGVCSNSCYYCPVSDRRMGSDFIYANERPVMSMDDAVDEALSMSAEGVSITGGEPLLKPERIYEYLEVFSSAGLHTHLYTSIPARERMIEKLSEKGLDEIRFHPPELKNIMSYEESIKLSRKAGIEAGIEIPAISFRHEIPEILNRNDAFLNVNELEFSESNLHKLSEMGWERGEFYEASGSLEIAVKYSETVRKFHYCSVRFKEIAQFRRRLIRTAFNLPEFYRVTSEGTVVCGLVEGEKEKIRKVLIQRGIDFVEVDEGFEIPVDEAERMKDSGKVFIIERYPTYTRMILEKDPLG